MAANGELVIAVGQELDYREDLIEEMILGKCGFGLPVCLF